MRERIDPDQGIGNYVAKYIRIEKRIVLGPPNDLFATPESLAGNNGLLEKFKKKKDIDTGYVIVGTNRPRLIMLGTESISKDEEARRKTITLLQITTHGYTVMDMKTFREKT